jgi:hypothetical protein
MSQLDEYLTQYIFERATTLEKYVLKAFDAEDKRVLCIDAVQEAAPPNQDLKSCRFLTDVEIFTEDATKRHDGHNYRVFHLTQKGSRFAQVLKQEMLNRDAPEATPTLS